MDKTKVIIFSGIGIAVLLVGYLFFRAAGKHELKTDTVQVSSHVEDKYTYKEMMAANPVKGDDKDYDTLGSYTVPTYGGGSTPPATVSKTDTMAPQSTDEARLNEALRTAAQKNGADLYKDEHTEEVRKVQREILAENKRQEIPAVANRPPVLYNLNTAGQGQQESSQKGKVIFYDEDDRESQGKSRTPGAVLLQAVTHGDQRVNDGGTIKLRTTQDATVNEIFLPRNSSVYGLARFENNRITVTVTTIKKDGGNIYVNLTAYDQRDGRAGLNVDGGSLGTEWKDAGEQAGDDATAVIDNMPVVGTVSRGVKQVFSSRRNRNPSILIGSNYKIFLK